MQNLLGRKLQGATAGDPTDGSLQRTGKSGRKLQQEAYPGIGAVARTVCASFVTLSRSRAAFSMYHMLHWVLVVPLC